MTINEKYNNMNSANLRSHTEPCSEEYKSTTNSFGSLEFRLNSQPFIPKSQNKDSGTYIYDKENLVENEIEEYDYLF